MEKCYNIVEMEARSGGLWGLRTLDMAEVVVMIIILIGNSVLKKIVYTLKWNTLHLQSHAGHVVTSQGNRSIGKVCGNSLPRKYCTLQGNLTFLDLFLRAKLNLYIVLKNSSHSWKTSFQLKFFLQGFFLWWIFTSTMFKILALFKISYPCQF